MPFSLDCCPGVARKAVNPNDRVGKYEIDARRRVGDRILFAFSKIDRREIAICLFIFSLIDVFLWSS